MGHSQRRPGNEPKPVPAPFKGQDGALLFRVNGTEGTATADTTAPAFASAAANGASLVITFDEDLAAAASLANSAFTVKKTASGGSEATVALSTTVAPVISGTTVTLTLDTALVSTDGSVKVTYTKPTTGSANKLVDAGGNETATFTDQTVTNNTPATSCAAPNFGTRRSIWTGSLTVGSTTGAVGFVGTTGALDDKTFSIGSSNHEIDGLALDLRDAPNLTLIFSLKDTVLTSAEKAALRLHVCNTTTVDLSAAIFFSSNRNYNVAYSGAAWTSGSTLAVYLSLPANNAATGAPTISGTAAVGETLMAATGTIADVDGVPTTLTYQWLRVDGATETDITGATESSYTVTADDIGKTLKVKVGFTDDLSGEEARSSAATATVAQPPTVSIAAVHTDVLMRVANPEFRVTLSAAQTSAVTVNISITQAANYLSSTTQSIEIQANQTSATKKFSSFYSGATSGDLTATVAAGRGYLPAPPPANAATVTVLAPGNAAILSYQLAEAAYSVTEGDSLDVVVTLRTAAGVPKPRERMSVSAILTEQLTGEPDMAILNVDYTHTSETGGLFAPDAWSADGAVFTATRTHTIPTIEDSAYEGNERFRILLTAASGAIGSKGSPGEAIVTIVDDEALKVTGVAVSSTPSSGSAYGAGETISFTATFSAKVTVTGTPQLPFSLGGVTKQAAYASGSDSAALVFSYTVAAGDNDADGVSWSADALSLNGGTIKFMTSIVANRVDAALTHAAKTAQSDHKVDTPPVLSTRTVNVTALVLTYNEALDTGSEPASSAFTVKVGGTAVSLATSGAVAVSGSTVTLTLAAAVTASATVTVSYAVPGSNPLQDAGGTDAPAFTDLAVTNGTGNTAPAFTNATAARSFTETVGDAAVTTAGNVGAVVTATDGDGDTLTYSLEGADAAKFGIVSGSGQIQTRAGEKYDRETKVSYSVTVKADDGNGGADTVAVTISVTNVVEIPLAPGMPAVSATSGSTTRLDVSWTAPVNTGRPALSGYKLQYRQGSSGGWTDHAHSGTGTTATIASLTASAAYEVQVRAVNADGDGAWSASGTGTIGSPSNNAPEFSGTTAARSFTETVGDATEAAARDVGAVVTATDADGDTLTYSLEGTDAAKFTVNSSSGQLRTRAGERYDREAKASYAVRVKADDSNGGTDTVAVTITLTNVVEKPLAPVAPAVSATSGSTTSLDVSWSAPGNTGRPALSGYKLQYRQGSSGGWTDHAHSGTGTTATIASLTAATAYEVQVRAVNADGDGAWSASGTGTTGSSSNNAPEFSDTTAARSFTETVGDAVAAASNVGAVVTATDAEGDTLTYTLGGADVAKFTVNSSSGQLRTRAGERYDREAKASYAVTVKASDPSGGSDTVAVTISVDNVVEIPLAPAAPTVSATSGSTTSLDVRWSAPGNTGRPALSGYKLQYRQGSSGGWTDHAHSGAGTTATIAGLTAATAYEVQVRAVNADGDGAWSASGSGTTGSLSNNAPAFSSNTTSRSFTETVGDAVAAASNVGAVVTATDADNDTLTYSLEGTDAAKFTVNSSSGQIRTKAGERYDREAKASYAVRVKADDGMGGADTVAVTITLANAVEIPLAPGMPAVAATSGSTTSLDVRWRAPGNAGRPAITGYKLQYRQGGSGGWTAHAHSGTGTTATLGSLATDTTYQVQVRALNADGDGPWSAAGSRSTGAVAATVPGAPRNLAAAPDNARVTLSWSAPASDGGAPITTYRYRHGTRTMSLSGAAWTEVPDSDADGDGADEREVTVTGLTNGTEYPFEVQALIRPSAPRELRAAGSLYSGMALGLVKLSWEAPADLGNAALIRYEYRYAARGAALSSARWNHGPISERTTVRNLAAGTSYTFQLRAVTLAGAGSAATVRVTTPHSTRLSLSVFTRGAAVEGENLTIGVRRSGIPASDEDVLVVVDIYDSAGARWSAKAVDIAVGAREGTVAFAVPFDGARGAARELAVTLSQDSWDPLGSTYIVGTPASATVPVRNRDPLLRVANATVREGPQAQLSFDVSLDRAAAVTVTVDYATADGTATAGADYTATSSTLSFAAGETQKTITVAVLDDAHDEGTETLTLTLSNARGAAIDDATATGWIVNTDPMPAAWLARFGRTGATQVLGLLDARFDEARAPASQLTLGGRPVNLSGLRGAPQGRADPSAGPVPAHTDPAAGRTAASPLTPGGGSQGRADPGAEPAPADADPFDVLASRYTLDDSARGAAARHADPSADPDPGAEPAPADADPFDVLASRYTLDDSARGAAARHADPSAVPDPAAGAVGGGGEATLLERLAWRLLTRGGWSVDRRQFLSGSSFDLSLSALGRETDAAAIETARVRETPGHWSMWGRGALVRFTGQDRGLSLDGDVLTGLLGLDYSRGRWLAGVGLAYNDGDGAYRASDSGATGELDSTLVSVHPYLHYALTERLSAWGTLGYGAGGLRLRLGRDGAPELETLETDIQMRMGALGLRGTVFASVTTELALKSDLMWVRTTSSATAGLAPVDGADASRVRLLLTGRHRHVLATGAELTPNVELGLRYDDGAAETGAGVELGGGLRYADPVRGLTVEATARALLAHEAGGYEEWGMGGSLQLDPGRLGRGLSLRLASGWGLTDSSTETLWQQQTASGLARGPGQTPQGRIRAEWAYGLDVPRTRGLFTPYGSVEMAGGGGRTLALGWRFELGQSLSLRLTGERRETALARPEHGLMLQTALPW